MNPGQCRLLEIIAKTSFRQDAKPVFHLASGIDSKYYVDCKQALSFPEARGLIAEMILERISPDAIDAVGGLEIGAYPIATTLSDRVYAKTGRSIRVFVVRKEPKKHGIRDLIAGLVESNDRALIVDDVITSGSSAIHAVKTARAAGLRVDRVIAIVDREESHGRENIEENGVQFEALFTLKDLIAHSAANGKTRDSEADRKRSVRGQPSRVIAAG
jgi:orotate phosphoribosyltransferase